MMTTSMDSKATPADARLAPRPGPVRCLQTAEAAAAAGPPGPGEVPGEVDEAAQHATAAASAGPADSADRIKPEVKRSASAQRAERLQAAAHAMREGRPVLLTDDGDRENEADFIVAAERLTVLTMAQLIRDGSGIVCLCLPPAHAERLGLAPMVRENESRYGTAFTVSIEARRGTTTGVSAADRVTTVRAATQPGSQRGDIVSPGHIFPLIAHPQGVLGRRGHTEGALELCALAGLPPAAVLCELMNPDGTMARGPQLASYAARHGLPVLSIEDLVAWCAGGELPVGC